MQICGLPAIANEFYKFVGIRNGIDCDIWDPENDQFLPMPYSARNVVEGKKAARDALRYRLGLTGWGDKPVVGVVSRLTAQKGMLAVQYVDYGSVMQRRGGGVSHVVESRRLCLCAHVQTTFAYKIFVGWGPHRGGKK